MYVLHKAAVKKNRPIISADWPAWNHGQRPVPMVALPPRPQAPVQATVAAPPQGQPAQTARASLNPVLRCIKVLACWDCGPVGIFIAIAAFITGTVVTYEAFELAIWTATKDYIVYCQSDVAKARADTECHNAANQNVRPPPFYNEIKSLNRASYHRTIRGLALGVTETSTHNAGYIWVYALLCHAISWLVLSKICQITWSMAETFRTRGLSPLLHVGTGVPGYVLETSQRVPMLRPDTEYSLDGRVVGPSSSTGIRLVDKTSGLRFRNRDREKAKTNSHGPQLLVENPSCNFATDPKGTLAALKDRSSISARLTPLDMKKYAIRSVFEYRKTNAWENNPAWRDDIRRFIEGCLEFCGPTGFNGSTKTLLAFWAHGKDSCHIELPVELCPWVEFVGDIDETLTLAVISGTCLSAKEISSGRTCNHGKISTDRLPVLETRITIRGSDYKWVTPQAHREVFSRTTWNDWKLSKPGDDMSGRLDILQVVPDDRQGAYCISKWDSKRLWGGLGGRRARPKLDTFREELIQDEELRGCVTYVLPATRRKGGAKRE
ncbi:hypothetical protein DL98DRAFT_575069 [Cadophora sp. DSE1049]|nr:hypothetical protein DL98DRAFT_575069 [Cadophora sp. DSE1049]